MPNKRKKAKVQEPVDDMLYTIDEICPNIVEALSHAPFVWTFLEDLPEPFRAGAVESIGLAYILGCLDGAGEYEKGVSVPSSLMARTMRLRLVKSDET